MAVAHIVLVGAALLLTFFSSLEAGDVGVCYGMQGSDLMQPLDVVKLLKNNRIGMVRLYDANARALNALAKSGIKVGVSLPNENLADAAGDPSYARQWVQSKLQAHLPDTLINSVAVGNEVFHQVTGSTSLLLPAMKNIHSALVSVGLADTIKVITPIAMDALKVSFPPSAGAFKDELADTVMRPMIHFLRQTGSYLTFNIYPYFAYKQNPDLIDLNYVLFLPNSGQRDTGNGLMYYNMFDAMTDAVFHAVEKLSSSAQHTQGRKMLQADDDFLLEMKTQESGLPHPPKHKKGALQHEDSAGCISCQKSVEAATTENAKTYNNNLISKVLRGTGTPYKPNARISVYIFSLFNENLKTGGDEEEKYFGLFYPDGTPVYKVDFVNPGPPPGPAPNSWCTAKPEVGDKRLQAALDFACGSGADCAAIQPGKSCYQPNTLVAHASYAFNSYYQRMGRATGTCDFEGAGSVVYNQPATCAGNGASWCVAKPEAGDSRLQAALDFACGHGADCSAIQAGGRCFDPNTKLAHASYAFNDYYKLNGRSDESCYFNDCGTVVHQQPSGKFGNCVL